MSRLSLVRHRLFIFAVGVALLSGCATVYPMKQYVVAREAVESARDVEAARYAPGLWYKAEEAFRRAKRDFDEKEFKSAMEGFEVARVSAEKAENSARYQRQKLGEEVP